MRINKREIKTQKSWDSWKSLGLFVGLQIQEFKVTNLNFLAVKCWQQNYNLYYYLLIFAYKALGCNLRLKIHFWTGIYSFFDKYPEISATCDWT